MKRLGRIDVDEDAEWIFKNVQHPHETLEIVSLSFRISSALQLNHGDVPLAAACMMASLKGLMNVSSQRTHLDASV